MSERVGSADQKQNASEKGQRGRNAINTNTQRQIPGATRSGNEEGRYVAHL